MVNLIQFFNLQIQDELRNIHSVRYIFRLSELLQ